MYVPSVFINEAPALSSVVNFLSAFTDSCERKTMSPLGLRTITLTGVPEYKSRTSPEIKIVSPSEYDDLSVVTTIEF